MGSSCCELSNAIKMVALETQQQPATELFRATQFTSTEILIEEEPNKIVRSKKNVNRQEEDEERNDMQKKNVKANKSYDSS